MREKLILWLAKKLAVIIIKWRGNQFHYEKVIKQAEKLAGGTRKCKGKRTYVYFIGGKYRALNRKQIQYWRNHTKGVRQGLKVSEMTGIQLYDTQGHVNSHPTYKQLSVQEINIQYIRSKDL